MGLSARLLVPGEESLVDDFLKPHTPFALYLRSYVKRAGLVFNGRPYEADTFGAFDGEKLVGVLAHGWIGNVQIFSPDLAAIPLLVEKWRAQLAKQSREIALFLGPRDHMEKALSCMGLDSSAMRQKGIQDDLYVLSLAKLIAPPLLDQPDTVIRYAQKADRDILIGWKSDYNVETLGAELGEANLQKAKDEIIRRTEQKDLYILEKDGRPVAFCGAEMELPDWCGIGPVWTPVKLRNRGYGRAVTAGAMRMLRDRGVENAMLYAYRPDAVKAYTSLGFERIGEWYFNYLSMPILKL